MMMIMKKPVNFSLLILLNIIIHSSLTVAKPFNISHYIYPKISQELRPQPPLFLQGVLERIAEKEKWKVEDIRVSNLEIGKVKYGVLQGYEIRVRLGKNDFVLKFWDEVSLWKKFNGEGAGDFESLANEVSSNAVIDSLKIDGPFELIVADDDELSLMLPLSISHTGLKRVLVPDGITVDVKSAQAISLLHTSALDMRANKSLNINREESDYGSFAHSLCMPLTPIKIFGRASVVAYRTRNADAQIESFFVSKDTIELLPEKCYSSYTIRSKNIPVQALHSRIILLEKLLRRILGDRADQKPVSRVVKIKLKASSVFRFQLELQRDIRSNDTHWSTMAEWRTRPTVERVWFEALTRIEMGRLKPLMIKRVKPFIGVDSWSWSKLMSNISFTKFPSDLVAPEPLTLDVRW